MADSRPADEVVVYWPEAKPRADILPVTPETKPKGLLSAIELNHEVYIQYILCFATIAAISTRAQY